MLPIPTEVNIGGVYISPLFLAGIVGVLLAWLVTMGLNRFRLSRFFMFPQLVFLALATIFTVLIGTFILPG